MPTRGRFVCHVHCLVHDGAVRSSPCGPHNENFGQNLYHMFVPAYSASQSYVFVLFCGIRVASMPSVDSIPYSKRCSHIPMWILILLDHRVCHLNSISNRCVSLRDDPIILPSRKINNKFSQRCLFHLPQVVFVFPALPPSFLQGLRFLNQVSFFIDAKSLHSFLSMFLSGDFP